MSVFVFVFVSVSIKGNLFSLECHNPRRLSLFCGPRWVLRFRVLFLLLSIVPVRRFPVVVVVVVVVVVRSLVSTRFLSTTPAATSTDTMVVVVVVVVVVFAVVVAPCLWFPPVAALQQMGPAVLFGLHGLCLGASLALSLAVFPRCYRRGEFHGCGGSVAGVFAGVPAAHGVVVVVVVVVVTTSTSTSTSTTEGAKEGGFVFDGRLQAVIGGVAVLSLSLSFGFVGFFFFFVRVTKGVWVVALFQFHAIPAVFGDLFVRFLQ